MNKLSGFDRKMEICVTSNNSVKRIERCYCFVYNINIEHALIQV